MRKPRSFQEIVLATAEQKHAAAQARKQPDQEAEKPRDVILGACETIAAALATDGFAYLGSGPKLKRADGDLSFEINFQSDRNNIAGKRAAVWIHGGVRSAALGRWRRTRPMQWGVSDGPDVGLVTGGQIGNLTDRPAWHEWDFADGAERAGEIADAIEAIRRIILPFFALFADPDRAVDALLCNPVLRQSSLLEYAVAVLGREPAEAAGRRLLNGDPTLRQSFESFAAQFREHGLPRFIGNQASDLAAVAIVDGLDLSSQGQG